VSDLTPPPEGLSPLEVYRRLTQIERDVRALKHSLADAVEDIHDVDKRLDDQRDEIDDIKRMIQEWQTANSLMWQGCSRKLDLIATAVGAKNE